ncbi:MAG: AAA family ATPase [Phycisphaerales bacterium]
MRTIAVINQKGGCGKTTTAINLAGVFASRGLRTLLVDVDPQSHCAAGLAIPEQRIDLDIGDAMLDAREFDPARLLWRVSRNLDLAPSRMRLAGLEAARGGLADRPDKEQALRGVLHRLSPGYDACCIDCPPGIGLLTYNALVAADTVLIPVETSYFSLRGAAKQIDTIKSISRRLGMQTPYWLLATIHDESSALARDLLSELRREFDSRVCPVVIRSDAALKEASSFGQTIADYAPESEGAADYLALADWWLGQGSRQGAKGDAGGGAVAGGPGSPQAAPEDEPPMVHVRSGAGRAVLDGRGGREQDEHPPAVGSGPVGGQATPEARSDRAATPAGRTGSSDGHSPGTGGGTGAGGSGAAVPAGGPGGAGGSFPPRIPESREQPPTRSEGDQGTELDMTQTASTATVIEGAERAMSRTEDLVRRALLLQRPDRVERPIEPKPAPVRLVIDAEDEDDAPASGSNAGLLAGGSIARLLGARKTARGVLFVQPLAAGRSVAVAGEFNGWSATAHQMRANKGLGVFEVLIDLPPGEHSYRLVVDGVWKPDPFNPLSAPNPFGEANSVVRIDPPPTRP